MSVESVSRKLALVTGGTGYIGRHLAQRLLSAGHRVRVLARDARAVVDGAEFVQGDARDAATMQRAVSEVETVYHLAGRAHAFGDPPFSHEQYDVSVGSALALTQALYGRHDARVVFMSSIAVYGDAEARCHLESDTPTPTSAYGGAKLLAERALLGWGAASGSHVVCLRPAAVYGPRAPGNLDRLLRGALRGTLPRLPRGALGRMMVHVQDLVDACLLVAERSDAAGHVYNVADGGRYSSTEIVDAVLQAHPHKWPVPRAPEALLRAAASLGDLATPVLGRAAPLDSKLLNKLLGPSEVSCAALAALGFRPRHTLWSALPSLLTAVREN
jgi:nucleoside-diphosphate-sugar epimerase